VPRQRGALPFAESSAGRVESRRAASCARYSTAAQSWRRIARHHDGRWDVGIESLLIFLIVGAIAGWLAGQIVKGHGFGLVGNIVVGIIGAFIAGWLLPQVGLAIGGGYIAAIINALIGAIILLFLIGLFKRA